MGEPKSGHWPIKGGYTTKILALTGALGNLVRFVLLPGQRYGTGGVAPRIAGIEFEGLIAGKAFDSNWIIAVLNARGAKIVISQRPQRRLPLAIDEEFDKIRHLIKNFFSNSRTSSASFSAQRNRSERDVQSLSILLSPDLIRAFFCRCLKRIAGSSPAIVRQVTKRAV